MVSASMEVLRCALHSEVWSGLALADIKSRYRRTALGPFWMTLSMSVMVCSVGIVYAGLFGNEITHYLPFLATGIIVWTYISTCIIDGCNVFITAAGFIKSVPLPLASHVFRALACNALILAHNAVLIIFLWMILGWSIGFDAILAVLGLLIDTVALVGIALTLGILSARFRDIPPLIAALVQLLFLLTPIMWMPSALKSPALSLVIELNPIYYLIEVVRGPLLGQTPPPKIWLIAILLAVACLATGVALYSKLRHRVAYWL